MALTFVYTVTGVKVKNEVNSEGATHQNAVCQTHWKIVGTDENDNSAEFVGATPFTAANVPAATFTSFENLVEANVISWIQAVVDGDAGYKEHITMMIEKQIEAETESEPDLPWGTPDGVTPVADNLPE
tara:strand:- start:436 stop:822 length:387 start_codon:yes stop_codon:yes gene_type:complete